MIKADDGNVSIKKRGNSSKENTDISKKNPSLQKSYDNIFMNDSSVFAGYNKSEKNGLSSRNKSPLTPKFSVTRNNINELPKYLSNSYAIPDRELSTDDNHFAKSSNQFNLHG